jgi:hypothetical protein
MAKWFVVNTDGEPLTKNDRDGSAETSEFDDAQAACSCAASFLIPFGEHEPALDEVRRMREVGKALEETFGRDDVPEEDEAEEDVAELEVVCLEKGVRIRMAREPLGIIANSREQ